MELDERQQRTLPEFHCFTAIL